MSSFRFSVHKKVLSPVNCDQKEIVSKVGVDDFVPTITEQAFTKCDPDWRIWQRQTVGHGLMYVVKGNAHYTVNGVVTDVEAGDLLYLSEGDMVEASVSPTNLMQCYTVNFTFDPQFGRQSQKSIPGGGGTLKPYFRQ